MSIFKRYWEISDARTKVLQEAMKLYDEQVFHPAMEALREECSKEGHSKGKFHDNGLGSCWWYCSKCSTRMEEDE